MARNIGTDAVINQVRLAQQGSHPSSPASGYESLYIVSGSVHGGLFLKDSAGKQIGPFITGTGGSTVWNQVINEDGTSFANFSGTAGTWSSDGTVIKQTDTSASAKRARFNTAVNTNNFILEAEIQIKSSGVDRIGGILVGYDGSNTGALSTRINEGSDLLQMEVEGIIARFSKSATINIDTWYKLRAVCFGGRWMAYLDGALIGSSIDHPFTQSAFDVSFVGLFAYQSEVWFRNIKGWTLELPV